MNNKRLLHKIEGVAVAIATGGALSGLHDVKPLGLPVDKWGMYADLVAGSIALFHYLHHKLKGKAH